MAWWNGIAGVISRSCRGRIRIKLPIIRPENCSEIWVPRRSMYVCVSVCREGVSKAPVVSVLLLPPPPLLLPPIQPSHPLPVCKDQTRKNTSLYSLSLEPTLRLFEALLPSVALAIRGGHETERERKWEGDDDGKDGKEWWGKEKREGRLMCEQKPFQSL